LGQVPKKEKTGWKSAGFPGVRYREHLTRRHGKMLDRYYAIRYRFQEKNFEEPVGWASEGVKPTSAFHLLGELKQNQRMGTPPFTLAEKRALEDAQRQAEAEAEAQQQVERITVNDFFHGDYLAAQAGKKPGSIRRERDFYEMFIGPEIGNKTFREVSPFDVERIKAKMARTDRAPRTIQYCMAVIRQIFNTARFNGLHDREAPTLRVKKPRFDNKRTRHLTEAEAEALLSKLKSKSVKTYMQTILSLYAGLRFGEIASLTWGDVDLDRGILMLRDTKSGRTRAAFITEKIRTEVFDHLPPGRLDDLVFPDRNGG
jgi:integrase